MISFVSQTTGTEFWQNPLVGEIWNGGKEPVGTKPEFGAVVVRNFHLPEGHMDEEKFEKHSTT